MSTDNTDRPAPQTPGTPDDVDSASASAATPVTGPVADMALLAGCGVLTAIPLLLFSAAANRISLTVIGFIQYVSPTIALVRAVAFFGEQFTMAHGICFALIWAGIAAIGVEAAWAGRRKRAAEAAPPVPAAVSSPNPSSAAMFTDAPPAER